VTSAQVDTPEPPAPSSDGSLTLHTSLLGDLIVPSGAARAAELEALSARAAVYATRARGPGTRRTAWSSYEGWCRSLWHELLVRDPDTLAMFGVALDLRDPRLVMVLEGIARSHGTRLRPRAAAAACQHAARGP